MFVPKKRRYLTEINVIPYVDVMLVLLVIFMVTAPFMIQGIDINLPEVNSQPIDKANLENITISINAEGKFYLDLDSLKGKAFLINELKQEINNLKESFSMLLNLTEKMLEEPTKDEVVKRPSSFKALKKESKKDIISILKNKNIIK